MPSAAELERARLEAEADADFEFAQKQKAKPASAAQAPQPKPALSIPKPPFVTDADVAEMAKRQRVDATPEWVRHAQSELGPDLDVKEYARKQLAGALDIGAKSIGAQFASAKDAEKNAAPTVVTRPAGTMEEASEAQSPEQQEYLAEQFRQHPEVYEARVVPPTPLAISRRLVRWGAGAVQGVTGESALGHAVDIGSAYAEKALDPFASEQEKAQHEKDIAEAVKGSQGAKGELIEFAGGPESEAWRKAGEALHKGEYKQALKSVTPRASLDIYREMEKQREERKVGKVTSAVGGAKVIGNAIEDLFGVVGGLAESANSIVGFTVEEKGKRGSEGAHEAGKGLTALPGQAASLGKGLFSLDNNALLTHPFSTFLTVVEPLRGVMAPAELAAKTKAAASHMVDAVWQNATRHSPEAVARAEAAAGGAAKLRSYMEQAFEDGLSVHDKRQAGQLDLNINDPQAAASAVITAGERIAEQARKGLVKGIEPALTPTDVRVTPASPRGKALKAARESREAATNEALRIADRRAKDIETAERATDTAESRAATAGNRMGEAEAAASNAGVRMAARNADYETALSDEAQAIYAHKQEAVKRRPGQSKAAQQAELEHGLAQSATKDAEHTDLSLVGQIDTLRKIIEDNAAETDHSAYWRKRADDAREAAMAADMAGDKNAKALIKKAETAEAKSARADELAMEYARSQLAKLERQRDRAAKRYDKAKSAEDKAKASLDDAYAADVDAGEKWGKAQTERELERDVEFDRKRIDIENKQARMEQELEAARKRHADANDAYDKAQENHQYFKDLEAKARDDYSQALEVADALRQKQAAITGRGKKSLAPALEKATADAQRLGVTLQEAVRKADEAREKATVAADRARDAAAKAVTADEIAAAHKLQQKAVLASLDAQRVGLTEADRMAATKAAAEDVRRVQAAPTDMDAGKHWGPAPEGEMVLHDADAPAAEMPATESALDDMILRKTDEAAKYQQEALINGLDVRAMVPDEMQAIFPKTAGKTVLEAAKDLANHVAERNKENPVANIEGVLLQMGVPEQAAAPFAKWLWAEEELDRIMHITEREGGAIRMPQTEVTRYVVEPGGRKLVEQGKARALADAADLIAKVEDNEHREGLKELADMESRTLRKDEKPIGFRTDNKVFEQAVDDAYDAYARQLMPEHLRMGEFSRFADDAGLSKVPAVSDYYAQLGEVVKPMSRDRFAARYLRQLDETSSQLLIHPSVRHAFERRFAKKLKDAGIHGSQMRDLRSIFSRELEDSAANNITGKNRFVEVQDNRTGKMLWDESDYFNTMKEMGQLKKIKAQSLTKFTEEMADSVHGLGVMNKMVDSAYGVFRDEHGAVDPSIFANPSAYAKKLVEHVIDQGRMKPVMQPYSGKSLALNLHELATREKDPVRAAKIEVYADELKRDMVSVAEHGALSSALPRWYKQMFNGTELPGVLVNLHMPKDIARAYASHFFMLSGASGLGAWGDAIHTILSRSKANVVPANIAALINNNGSNSLANMFRRGDPLIPVKVINAYLITRRYLKGELDGLAPEVAADMRSLFKTDIRSSTFVSAELRRDKTIAKMADFLPFELAAKAKRLSLDLGHLPEKPGLGIDYINGGLRWAYQEMGDMPFRVEQALDSMKIAREKVGLLQPGESLDLPVSRQRTLRLVRNADGTIQVLDPFRSQEPLLSVAADSDAMRDILAHHGNFVQSQRFFDYNKIGAWPKYLRTPVAQPISGIFTWFWLASDIPGVKKGLVDRMVLEGDELPTTSPAVQKLQRAQQLRRALSRAVLTTSGQQAIDEDLKAEGVRRTAAFDKTDNSVILRKATNPKYAYARNLGPVLFVKPSMIWAQMGQSILQDLEFNDLWENPAELQMLLRPSDKQLEDEAKLSVNERLQLNNRREQLNKALLGETFNIKNWSQIIGLTGSPAVNTLLDTMNGRITAQEARRQFLAQMLGTTAERMMEVGLAGAGLAADSPELVEASSYGKPANVSSMRGAVDGADESGNFLQWALNFVTSLGWKTVDMLGTENDVTGKKQAGAIARIISDARKGVGKSWVDAANQRVSAAMLLADKEPTPENKKRLEDAEAVRDQVQQTLKWYYGHMEQNLRRQYKELP